MSRKQFIQECRNEMDLIKQMPSGLERDERSKRLNMLVKRELYPLMLYSLITTAQDCIKNPDKYTEDERESFAKLLEFERKAQAYDIIMRNLSKVS